MFFALYDVEIPTDISYSSSSTPSSSPKTVSHKVCTARYTHKDGIPRTAPIMASIVAAIGIQCRSLTLMRSKARHAFVRVAGFSSSVRGVLVGVARDTSWSSMG